MFCLRCGRQTADDSEFCSNCAEDPVTEQSLEAQAEHTESELAQELVRCPACNQQVLNTETNCPRCGARIRVAQ